MENYAGYTQIQIHFLSVLVGVIQIQVCVI